MEAPDHLDGLVGVVGGLGEQFEDPVVVHPGGALEDHRRKVRVWLTHQVLAQTNETLPLLQHQSFFLMPLLFHLFNIELVVVVFLYRFEIAYLHFLFIFIDRLIAINGFLDLGCFFKFLVFVWAFFPVYKYFSERFILSLPLVFSEYGCFYLVFVQNTLTLYQESFLARADLTFRIAKLLLWMLIKEVVFEFVLLFVVVHVVDS